MAFASGGRSVIRFLRPERGAVCSVLLHSLSFPAGPGLDARLPESLQRSSAAVTPRCPSSLPPSCSWGAQ